jgi:2-hydroxychromene-2-carboxylate isomerase
MTKPLTIAVISDVVCPWCYVGKRRLEAALKELGQEAEIHWLPYELNPDMPKDGMERAAYRAKKFGEAKSAQFDAQLTALGREEGIPFAFDRQARTPNTRAAHQLIAFAGSQGKADAVVEALFKAYFEEGRDVGSDEVWARSPKRPGSIARRRLPPPATRGSRISWRIWKSRPWASASRACRSSSWIRAGRSRGRSPPSNGSPAIRQRSASAPAG